MKTAKKYLNPRNEVAFKRVFDTSKNKDILLAMLNPAVEYHLKKSPLKDVKLLKVTREPELEEPERVIMDVLCKDEDDFEYIIELQVINILNFDKQAIYYASKAAVEHEYEVDSLIKSKGSILLAFCNKTIFSPEREYKNNYRLTDRKTGESDHSQVNYTFVDLVKFEKRRTRDISTLTLEEKFYYFIRRGEKVTDHELEHLIGKDMIIKKAFDEIDPANWSDDDIQLYKKREKESKKV